MRLILDGIDNVHVLTFSVSLFFFFLYSAWKSALEGWGHLLITQLYNWDILIFTFAVLNTGELEKGDHKKRRRYIVSSIS